MARPELLTLDALAAELSEPGSSLWVLPRFRARAVERLGAPAVEGLDAVSADARRLAVVGGGTMIDEAKRWRRDLRPDLRLVAVPTLWGSGAEVSPVVALNRGGAKEVELDDALLPDARAVWAELARELDDARAREACGDAWSHALEAFLSPLASEELLAELADVLRELLTLPLGNDPRWFEASARACAAQARAGVGLVHGIAHTLEGKLAADLGEGERPFGHARLCALFLAPVLALDESASPKLRDRAAAHGLDLAAVRAVAADLFDAEAYVRCLPLLEEHWRTILRDPCTRTNGVLVRPAHLEHFKSWGQA